MGILGRGHFPFGGVGVGVRVWAVAYFVSIALRISLTFAPELCICIATRATSMQTSQVTPWVSQAFTFPALSRPATKQSSLPLWPPL